MKVNITEMSIPVLNWAVAQSEKLNVQIDEHFGNVRLYIIDEQGQRTGEEYSPVTNVLQGNEIIFRENIEVKQKSNGEWHASKDTRTEDANHWSLTRHDSKEARESSRLRKSSLDQFFFVQWHPDNYLIAAMRCHVAVRMGNSLDVPDILATYTDKNDVKVSRPRC